MKRRRQIARAIVFVAIVICLSASVAGGLTARAPARGGYGPKEAIAHDLTIEAKDLLLHTIHLGQRILVTASKRYAALTATGHARTSRECSGGAAS